MNVASGTHLSFRLLVRPVQSWYQYLVFSSSVWGEMVIGLRRYVWRPSRVIPTKTCTRQNSATTTYLGTLISPSAESGQLPLCTVGEMCTYLCLSIIYQSFRTSRVDRGNSQSEEKTFGSDDMFRVCLDVRVRPLSRGMFAHAPCP